MTRLSHALIPALIPLLLLAGCSTAGGGQGGQRSARGAPAMKLPETANPSAVVARELAFARMAREEGQWTAFRAFAAPGAVLHGQGGPIEALPWLEGKLDPPKSVQWAPRAVWSSCDGGTVVSFGRFAEPEGQFGYFVTVWERQGDGEYKYVYDFGWPDAELTRAEQKRLAEQTAQGEDNAILVEAYNFIEGNVAQCAKGETIPEVPGSAGGLTISSPDMQFKYTSSKDGTLQWRWGQLPDGTRKFSAIYLQDGQWAQALSHTVPAAGK
ncbi:MAG: hypothetical protein H6918_00285 [Sphingomonadaceae bacterium]|nr:hypothetical protein [Sphingomonadaceae bacterium]